MTESFPFSDSNLEYQRRSLCINIPGRGRLSAERIAARARTAETNAACSATVQFDSSLFFRVSGPSLYGGFWLRCFKGSKKADKITRF